MTLKTLYWKLFYAVHERTFKYKGHKVRYMFRNRKREILCVVFSAFPPKGSLPGYNMIRTLWNSGKADILYIRDDMVKIPTGGSYYLGSDGDYWGIDAVKELIKSFTDRKKYRKRMSVGSSKGGTAALLFGLKLQFDAVIIGACQYKIGSYLNCPYHYKSLQKLTGMENVTFEAIGKLDNIVPKVISEHKGSSTEIWFHYSDEEHTFSEQIRDLLSDLHVGNYRLHEDVMHYADHGDVGKFYPAYMLEVMNTLSN